VQIAEVRDLVSGSLLRSYDVTNVENADGVQWAIDASLADNERCVRVVRDEPLGELTDSPAPLAYDPVMGPPTGMN
jgi:hypothetical protein